MRHWLRIDIGACVRVGMVAIIIICIGVITLWVWGKGGSRCASTDGGGCRHHSRSISVGKFYGYV